MNFQLSQPGSGVRSMVSPAIFFANVRNLTSLGYFWTTTIDISNIHEDAGHTFVHFLYSGSYETIEPKLEEGESVITREYRQAVLAYLASRAYKLPTLEALAERYMELFSQEMSTPEILQTTKEVFSKLPEDETWFSNHIKSTLEQFLAPGESASILDPLYADLGRDHSFDNVVTRTMLEILSSLSRTRIMGTVR